MRKIALLGGASALAAFAVRALRRRGGGATFEEPSPALGDFSETAPPAEAKPPAEADPGDREAESRLDDETKYERDREEDEAARSDAAERLRKGPLAERLDADT